MNISREIEELFMEADHSNFDMSNPHRYTINRADDQLRRKPWGIRSKYDKLVPTISRNFK